MTYSTETVTFDLFMSHGTISFDIAEENILVFHSQGPFNAELIQALRETQLPALQELKKHIPYWGDLIIFGNSCLCTPEGLQVFTDYLTELRKLNIAPLASAYVFQPDVEGAHLMQPIYAKCYRDAGLTFEAFDNEAEAFKWVKSQTFI